MEQSDHPMGHRLSPKATASAPPLGQLRLKPLTLLQYDQLELEAAAALAATRSFELKLECSVISNKFDDQCCGSRFVELERHSPGAHGPRLGRGNKPDLAWPLALQVESES